jgi:chromosome segregation ATPase
MTALQTSQRARQWDHVDEPELRSALRRLDTAAGMAEHAAWLASMGRGGGATAEQLRSIGQQVQAAAHGVKAAAPVDLATHVERLETRTRELLTAAESSTPDLARLRRQLDEAQRELALARERSEQPKRDRQRIREAIQTLGDMKREARRDAAAETGSAVLASYYIDQRSST